MGCRKKSVPVRWKKVEKRKKRKVQIRVQPSKKNVPPPIHNRLSFLVRNLSYMKQSLKHREPTRSLNEVITQLHMKRKPPKSYLIPDNLGYLVLENIDISRYDLLRDAPESLLVEVSVVTKYQETETVKPETTAPVDNSSYSAEITREDWQDLEEEISSWKNLICRDKKCYKMFCRTIPCVQQDSFPLDESTEDEQLFPEYTPDNQPVKPARRVCKQETTLLKKFKINRPADGIVKHSESCEFPLEVRNMRDGVKRRLTSLELRFEVSYIQSVWLDVNDNQTNKSQHSLRVFSDNQLRAGLGTYSLNLFTPDQQKQPVTSELVTAAARRQEHEMPRVVVAPELTFTLGVSPGSNRGLHALLDQVLSDEQASPVLPLEYRVIGSDLKGARKDVDRRICRRFLCPFCPHLKFTSVHQLLLHLNLIHTAFKFGFYTHNFGSIVEMQRKASYSLPSPLGPAFGFRWRSRAAKRLFVKTALENASLLSLKLTKESWNQVASHRELFYLNGFSRKPMVQQEFDGDKAAQNSDWVQQAYMRHFYDSSVCRNDAAKMRKLTMNECSFMVQWNTYCYKLNGTGCIRAARNMALLIRGFLSSHGERLASRGMLHQLSGFIDLLRRQNLITFTVAHQCHITCNELRQFETDVNHNELIFN